jgi:hypothetical protein
MKVFISYSSSHDRKFVKALSKNLQKHGLSVWLGETDIKPGENFIKAISTAIRESDAMVVVWHHGSISPHVMTEAGIAFGQGKTIVPITDQQDQTRKFPLPFQPIVTDDPSRAAAEVTEILASKERRTGSHKVTP